MCAGGQQPTSSSRRSACRRSLAAWLRACADPRRSRLVASRRQRWASSMSPPGPVMNMGTSSRSSEAVACGMHAIRSSTGVRTSATGGAVNGREAMAAGHLPLTEGAARCASCCSSRLTPALCFPSAVGPPGRRRRREALTRSGEQSAARGGSRPAPAWSWVGCGRSWWGWLWVGSPLVPARLAGLPGRRRWAATAGRCRRPGQAPPSQGGDHSQPHHESRA